MAATPLVLCEPTIARFAIRTRPVSYSIGLMTGSSERLSVLAGPILDDGDQWFDGRDTLGSVRIQIPRRFWKVIAAVSNGALQAFGFRLEQDLHLVALEPEFAVNADWVPHMVALADLQRETTGLAFPSALLAADQYDEAAGRELAVEAEVPR